MDGSMCPITQLPTEILLLIIRKLTASDLVAFSRTCRRVATVSGNLRQVSFFIYMIQPDRGWEDCAIKLLANFS